MGHESCVETILDHSCRQIPEARANIPPAASTIEPPPLMNHPEALLASSMRDDCSPSVIPVVVDESNAAPDEYWRSVTLAYPIRADPASWPWIKLGYKEGSCMSILLVFSLPAPGLCVLIYCFISSVLSGANITEIRAVVQRSNANLNVATGPALGRTALHLAVRESQEAMAHTLLQYGADIEARDDSGSSTLR